LLPERHRNKVFVHQLEGKSAYYKASLAVGEASPSGYDGVSVLMCSIGSRTAVVAVGTVPDCDVDEPFYAPPSPPPAYSAELLVNSAECTDAGGYNYYVTNSADDCAMLAGSAGCTSIMFSEVAPGWGCRCCQTPEPGTPHSSWDVYSVVVYAWPPSPPSPPPPVRPSPPPPPPLSPPLPDSLLCRLFCEAQSRSGRRLLYATLPKAEERSAYSRKRPISDRLEQSCKCVE